MKKFFVTSAIITAVFINHVNSECNLTNGNTDNTKYYQLINGKFQEINQQINQPIIIQKNEENIKKYDEHEYRNYDENVSEIA